MQNLKNISGDIFLHPEKSGHKMPILTSSVSSRLPTRWGHARSCGQVSPRYFSCNSNGQYLSRSNLGPWGCYAYRTSWRLIAPFPPPHWEDWGPGFLTEQDSSGAAAWVGICSLGWDLHGHSLADFRRVFGFLVPQFLCFKMELLLTACISSALHKYSLKMCLCVEMT